MAPAFLLLPSSAFFWSASVGGRIKHDSKSPPKRCGMRTIPYSKFGQKLFIQISDDVTQITLESKFSSAFSSPEPIVSILLADVPSRNVCLLCGTGYDHVQHDFYAL
eukprot:scaffold898_cov168-Amphora_coffeaeformis.AAC.9